MKNKTDEPKAFKFIKYDKVGEAAAEDDESFLAGCFVETRDLAAALNPAGPRCLIVGNTGSGKSALLKEIRRKKPRTSVVVGPEELAFAYITNSSIIQWLLSNSIRLDPFFKLLWRHVFVVEIIKARFKIKNERDTASFFDRVRAKFNDQFATKVRAFEYLNQWGSLFWKETDVRVKEVLTTFEHRVTGASGGSLGKEPAKLDGRVETVDSSKQEHKLEISERARNVIHDPQLGLLTKVIEDLDVMMEGDPEPYYLLIDRLDDDWVDDSLKYPLLRTLIETVRSFRHLKKVKILVALRRDLLDRVFSMAKDPGFQEEKYETVQLSLDWTADELTAMLDKRVNKLVSSRYTSSTELSARSVFKEPKKSIEHILSRSRMRPRDVIQYVNYCIDRSIERDKISHQRVLEAELDYSQSRLTALYDEWRGTFPNLVHLVDIVRKKAYPLTAKDLWEDRTCELKLVEIAAGDIPEDEIRKHAVELSNAAEETAKRERFLNLLLILYHVGVVALKPEGRDDYLWAHEMRMVIPLSDLSESTKVRLHPCFSKALAATTR